MSSKKMMTMSKKKISKEDEELLIKDLCTRIPYHCKVHYRGSEPVDLTDYVRSVRLKDCRPYLRPLSSMTEEERSYIIDKCCIQNSYMPGGESVSLMPVIAAEWLIDFYNSHHFDFRGLIPKGLAIAVTEENNPYNK